ncbi:TetR/AcrR family transcriptional regulator [Methylobacterium sp. Leaf91]|jgi:TetR/AcrR family transcriptional repressor for divergent bdcA|uniref:TetR/AcrR family transcriptional regulator n=1 Tax=Methylobacterium sp. Leaf91 TaxID=1736247 RepID=UPI0006F4916C|nr:TetR/AcrR family transcriptional regulator [Methylobacterium sp. Leaf91]KQO85965.1 TetR family transcriptional regulator [Methylobacterium sp. Leaf91]
MARTGRPRGFDRDAAIEGAMRLFWHHGYDGTSLDRLRRGMGGISSASFYAAFGSKAALYREALDRYLASHGRVVAPLHDESLPPRERIFETLKRSARMQADTTHPTGCLVTLSALLGGDEDDAVRALTAKERASNRNRIRRCVEQAVTAGELSGLTNVEGLASLLDGILLGLSIQARDGVPSQVLTAAIETADALWNANRAR